MDAQGEYFVKKISIGRWSVTHAVERERSYTVALVGISLVCTCKGFVYRRVCKHLNMVEEHMNETAIQSANHGEFGEFDATKLNLIKQSVARGASDEELELFLAQCKRTGLDPFSRQIYAIKRWDRAAGREVLTVQVSIDGYRLIADRTGLYAGSDEPHFEGQAEESFDAPAVARVTVYKLVAGQPRAFTASARWAEFSQRDKAGNILGLWRKMPYHMLAKCAEALALRKAFPQELSGIYTTEEMPPPSEQPPRPTQQQSQPATLSPEQVNELEALFQTREADIAQLLNRFEVESLEDIPASYYQKIKAKLLSRPLRRHPEDAGHDRPPLAVEEEVPF